MHQEKAELKKELKTGLAIPRGSWMTHTHTHTHTHKVKAKMLLF